MIYEAFVGGDSDKSVNFPVGSLDFSVGLFTFVDSSVSSFLLVYGI